MRKAAFIFFTALVVFLLLPFVVLAQEAGEVPGADPWPYVAIAFNSGIVLMLVQLLKNKVLPILKQKAPYLIPLIGMVIGVASALVLGATGIDISPIGDVFGAGIASGALASTWFAVAKEVQNKRKLL
jgi:hypothetical protein